MNMVTWVQILYVTVYTNTSGEDMNPTILSSCSYVWIIGQIRFFNLGVATSPEEGKIKTSCTPFYVAVVHIISDYQKKLLICTCIYPTPLWTESDTRSIFKWSKAGLNSEFSFS